MSGVFGGIYNTFIRSNAVFLTTIFAGAFATQLIFDTGANSLFDSMNKGRQWKDIKHKYLEPVDDDDDE